MKTIEEVLEWIADKIEFNERELKEMGTKTQNHLWSRTDAELTCLEDLKDFITEEA